MFTIFFCQFSSIIYESAKKPDDKKRKEGESISAGKPVTLNDFKFSSLPYNNGVKILPYRPHARLIRTRYGCTRIARITSREDAESSGASQWERVF